MPLLFSLAIHHRIIDVKDLLHYTSSHLFAIYYGIMEWIWEDIVPTQMTLIWLFGFFILYMCSVEQCLGALIFYDVSSTPHSPSISYYDKTIPPPCRFSSTWLWSGSLQEIQSTVLAQINIFYDSFFGQVLLTGGDHRKENQSKECRQEERTAGKENPSKECRQEERSCCCWGEGWLWQAGPHKSDIDQDCDVETNSGWRGRNKTAHEKKLVIGMDTLIVSLLTS